MYTAPISVSIPCSVGNVRQALTAKPTWAGFEPLTFAIMGGASHTHNRSTTERVRGLLLMIGNRYSKT